jgi:hypothetical protein
MAARASFAATGSFAVERHPHTPETRTAATTPTAPLRGNPVRFMLNLVKNQVMVISAPLRRVESRGGICL